MNDEKKESFVFLESYREAANLICDPVKRLEFYESIIVYGLYGEEPEFRDIDDEVALKMAWVFIRPHIDTQKKKRGGQPGNHNALKKDKTNKNESKTNKTNKNESKTNANESPNVNVNVQCEMSNVHSKCKMKNEQLECKNNTSSVDSLNAITSEVEDDDDVWGEGYGEPV